MNDENNVIKLIRRDIASLNKENSVEIRKKIREYFDIFTSDFFNRHFIFVYGTLRNGQENYLKLREIYGEKKIQYIYTTTWDYKALYDLGQYPAMLSGTSFDSVIGDIVFVEAEVFNYIKQIKEEAGYILDTTVLWTKERSTGHCKCLRFPCYVADKSLVAQIKGNLDKYPKITSGDWVRYQSQTEAVKEESDTERNNKIMQMWGDEYPYY